MTHAQHVHRAFGLTVHSSVELPDLPRGRGSGGGRCVLVQVHPTVERTRPGTGPPAFATGPQRMWRSAEGWLMRYQGSRNDDSWTLRIAADGSTIHVERTEGVPLPDILRLVQSIGLASVLQLRGVLLLHACVAEVGGRAVLVLGASGSGKSTTAAALLRRGLALLSDDVAAIEVVDGDLVVHPGLYRLRVTPDSARATGWDPEALPRVFRTPLLGDKRHVELSVASGSFCSEARQIAAMFVLGPRTEAAVPHVERLGPREALAALRTHGYRDALLDRAQHVQRFPLIIRLAREVPLHTVCPPDDLAALPQLVDSLLARTAVSAGGA